jgi:hypothetical protein
MKKLLGICIILLILAMLYITNDKLTKQNKLYYCNINGYLQKIRCDFQFLKFSFYMKYREQNIVISEKEYNNSDYAKLIDPFSMKPYKYKILGDGKYMIYSIGPDGMDEEGKIIFNYNSTCSYGKFYDMVDNNDPEINGDIVMQQDLNDEKCMLVDEWKKYRTFYDGIILPYSDNVTSPIKALR